MPLSPRGEPYSAVFNWSREAALPLTALALFLVGYAVMILAWQDFAHWDDAQFTMYSLRGVTFPPQIWPAGGRFWPLGLQEFNLIGHLTRSVAGYYSFSVAEVIALTFVFFLWERQLSITSRVAIEVFALVMPSVITSFTELIYPERNLLLLLVCLALFVIRFEETHSVWWALAVVICTQMMLYLKEPAFLLLLTFAAARLLLRSRTSRLNALIRDEESRLDFCIAALSLVFLAYYVIITFPRTEAIYLTYRRVSAMQTARYYAGIDWLVCVFFIVVVVRTYRIFRGRTAPLSVLDPLALGGAIYSISYVCLGLTTYYYLAPVDLIAVIYLGHILLSSWGSMGLAIRAATAILVALILRQSLPRSAFLVFEEKYMIQQKAAIADLILNRYQRDPTLVRNLYFPFTSDYLLSQFASYLSYRGLPVEEIGRPAADGRSVEIFGQKIPRDGRCVMFLDLVCHAGRPANTGSLIVLLPEDWGASRAETTLYMQSSESLSSNSLPPHIPLPVRRLANRLWGIEYGPAAYVGALSNRGIEASSKFLRQQ